MHIFLLCNDRPLCAGRIKRSRRGLSLVELLIATAMMSILVLALGSLAHTLQRANEHSSGHSLATQHARVAVERIQRALYQAHANEQFPGFVVFSDHVGSWSFPDTLVVWQPSGKPANAKGMPLFSELVVICPDPNDPHRLLEITNRNDSRPTPVLSDTAAWNAELSAMKVDPSANQVELTNLLRAARTSNADPNSLRGAVRFNVRLRPSEQQWDDYQSGTADWEDLAWVQDIYGPNTGLRQAWCHFELQLMPGAGSIQNDPTGQTAVPFFGSAAIYYELRR